MCLKTRFHIVTAFKHFRFCFLLFQTSSLCIHLSNCLGPDCFQVFVELFYVFQIAVNGFLCVKILQNPITGRLNDLNSLITLCSNGQRAFYAGSEIALILLNDGALLCFGNFLSDHLGRHDQLKRQEQHQIGCTFLPQRKAVMLFGLFPMSSSFLDPDHDRSPLIQMLVCFILVIPVQEVV